MANLQYIGARYVIKVYENSTDTSSAEWEANTYYERLVMVTYNNSSYLSKKDVPASVGNPAENPEYWIVTGYYNGQIMYLQQQVTLLNNIIGDIDDLLTTDKTNIVAAINEIAPKINNISFVNVKNYGAVGDGVTFLNAYNDVPLHGTLYIPNGNYLLTSAIEIKKPISIIGDYTGWDFRVDQPHHDRSDMMKTLITSTVSGTDTGAIVIKENGVTIRNISIFCSGETATHGIYAPALDSYSPSHSDTLSNIIIENVSLYLNLSLRGGTYNAGIRFDCCCITSEFKHIWSYNFAIGIALQNKCTSDLISNCWFINCTTCGIRIVNGRYIDINSCACDCNFSENRCIYGYQIINSSGVVLNGCGCEQSNIAAIDCENSKTSINGCSSYNPNVSNNGSGGFVQLNNNSDATLIGCSVEPAGSAANNLASVPSGSIINVLSCEYNHIIFAGTQSETPNRIYINNIAQ